MGDLVHSLPAGNAGARSAPGRLGGADFEVVAIDIDTARLDRRQAFLDQAGVKSLAFYADPSADVFERLKQAGKVVGLPTTLLLDRRAARSRPWPGRRNGIRRTASIW